MTKGKVRKLIVPVIVVTIMAFASLNFYMAWLEQQEQPPVVNGSDGQREIIMTSMTYSWELKVIDLEANTTVVLVDIDFWDEFGNYSPHMTDNIIDTKIADENGTVTFGGIK